MNDVRVNLTGKEKVARELVGLEGGSKHFYMNETSAEDILKREAQEKFNTQVDEYVDKFNQHSQNLNDYAKSIAESTDNLEIMPLYDYVLIKPFDENPFQKISVSDSGLILDLGGQKPVVKSNETGEYIEEESFIHVGTVLEAGKECVYLKEGDVVMWPKTSEVPVPFFKQGLVLVNEHRITVVINEGLKERFS